MLFCRSLESSTAANDVCHKLIKDLDSNNMSMINTTSCAADGTLVMMDKKNDCLKLIKDENPEMDSCELVFLFL